MFKKDSTETKILLLSIMATLVITIISLISTHDYKDFAFAFGIISLAIGLVEMVIGFFSLIAGKSEYAKYFFISAGILLLISGVSCGGYALLR